MDGKDMACNCVRVYHAGQDIPAASHGLVDRLARLTKNIRRIPLTRDCLQSAILFHPAYRYINRRGVAL